MSSLCDTDYVNCTDSRQSVGCTILTMDGFIVDWSMAKHMTVSDILCQEKYKELAKCAKYVKFIQMWLG